MVEMGEIAKARHGGDVADAQVARQRIAQHLMGAFQPQLAHIGGKRDASALQELLHIALRQSEPAPDRRRAKTGIGKPPSDFLNNRLEPRCFDAAIDSGASEIALGIEHIRQQFAQMPIRQRRNGRGKAARTRDERDEIRLQNEGCGSVDGDRPVESPLGVWRDAARGLTSDP